MEISKVKFVVSVYDGITKYHGENYQIVIEKLTSTSLKIAKKTAKKLKELYPKNKVVIKEKFREGWKIIADF